MMLYGSSTVQDALVPSRVLQETVVAATSGLYLMCVIREPVACRLRFRVASKLADDLARRHPCAGAISLKNTVSINVTFGDAERSGTGGVRRGHARPGYRVVGAALPGGLDAHAGCGDGVVGVGVPDGGEVAEVG